MKKIVVFLAVVTLVHQPSSAQHTNVCYTYDPASAMREHPLDFIKMRLDVGFEPQKGLVKGSITHFFTPLRDAVDSFFLDGPGIAIESATLNGSKIRYSSNADGIFFYPENRLHFGENDSLTITYHATPHKGLYFIGWNDPANLSRKQIWTQGQGIDNRCWFPCYDAPNDKLITEITVRFDKEYKVLSNGVKVEERDLGDGTKLWHYKMSKPHASYLVMLGIGKYDVHESVAASGVQMRQWYYPEWKDRFEYTYKYNERIFNFLESEIGVPYAWESYSQIPVQDFMFGAMENTSATLFGDFFETDARSYNDRNYVAVNAHELTHQWFGDLITARNSNGQWLQESFATHYNLLAEREVFGNDHFDWARRQAYLAAINTTDKKPIAHSQAPTSLIYQKGSMVLEMLKYVTSRAEFNRAIKRYLHIHKFGNVNSDELLDAFEDELGIPLRWFWDEWVYRGGEPDYKVSYQDVTADKNRFTQFVVSQMQPVTEVTGIFKMPIVFEVHYKDGTTDKTTEWIEKETQVVRVPNPKNAEISYVLFDPNSEVLKSVTFEKPFEMLKAQALNAPNMIDRYDAVYAMRSIAPDIKRAVLQQVFEANTFHAIKTEIIYQLIADKGSESLVKMALHDKDVQVRKGVIMNTPTISSDLLADYELLLTDSSYQTIVTALEKLCNNFPANTAKYLAATKGIEGTNGRNVLMKWLEISLNAKADKNLTSQLIGYTSISYEFITRTNAMQALRRLNICDERLLANCVNACQSNNGRLSGPATETIKYFYAQDKYKAMITALASKGNWDAKEKETLNKIIN
jgi:aminopeptidase N